MKTFSLLSPELLDSLISEALALAHTATSLNEVPVGCVIAHQNQIISRTHNLVESSQDVSAHAEILAIREASQKLNNWRLEECILCVTLEPCTMCMGAIRAARIPVLVFGAKDEKQGAVGSLYDLSQTDNPLPKPRVISGIMEQECAQVLSDFFAKLRK